MSTRPGGFESGVHLLLRVKHQQVEVRRVRTQSSEARGRRWRLLPQAGGCEGVVPPGVETHLRHFASAHLKEEPEIPLDRSAAGLPARQLTNAHQDPFPGIDELLRGPPITR